MEVIKHLYGEQQASKKKHKGDRAEGLVEAGF